MGFSQAIIDAHREASAKASGALEANLRKHGIPERNDLGALQSLRARFKELSGAEFDSVLAKARAGRLERRGA